MSAAAPRARSKRALRSVVAAQFFSSLADNALLIVAIDLLMQRHAPGWMTPALRLFFYLSYVLLAAFAGAVADAAPKGRVLMATNLIKLGGCALLLWQVQPLVAYALVGLGAAAYSPAKYGILPELIPQEELVAANGWIEAGTVLSILFGVALGSTLVGKGLALPAIGAAYLLAAACTLAIPHSPARDHAALAHPGRLLRDFGARWRCCGAMPMRASRWPSPAFSGPRRPRCSFWCCAGRPSGWGSPCRRARCCRSRWPSAWRLAPSLPRAGSRSGVRCARCRSALHWVP